MKILISGASGFLGSALTTFLRENGHEVVRLIRPGAPMSSETVVWDPALGQIDATRLEGFDAVVHLSGESVSGRWTSSKKTAIHDSRVQGTKLLAGTLAALSRPSSVFISASATGYYGDRGDEILTEESAIGKTGFLPGVCREWEEAAQPLRKKGIRVVHLRFGVILGAEGGALAKMLSPFRKGLGGIIGSGRQYMSWVSLEDVLGVVEHALNTPALEGPVNVVSPEPVTNKEFTKALGEILHRPTIFPIPAMAAKLLFGEMAEELLLASTRVEPRKLLKSGYRFKHMHLPEALQAILK